MAKVLLKNVTKKFEDSGIVAVKDVTLEVVDKEFIVLVGPSGCGKSTTLRCVAGLEEVTDGDIYIEDRRVNDIPPKNRDIAMVFQNYALYPHMSVYNNMAFGLKLRKFSKKEIDNRVREAAEILGIQELLDRKPKALSGGQRQRVAVGRAIVRKPKVFLFDEPLSNLDAKLRVQMRAELSKLHHRLQATMIYVTHDQVEAMTMGDRIVVLKDGIIQQVADPITLYDKPNNMFVAGFIGTPPMNFLQGTLVKKKTGIFFNEGKFEVRLEDENEAVKDFAGKDVVFGIRPEDIYDKLYAKGATAYNTISTTVEVVEPMGAELYVYVTTGKSPIITRLDPHSRVQINQKMDLVFDMKKAHIFDPATELTVV
jgi:multiple sugar transport system ATP-binding protein